MNPLAGMLRERTGAPGFRAELLALLVDLCAVDTTPGPDPAVMRESEARVFERIRAYLGGAPWSYRLRPIPSAIAGHPAFSPPHFTRTAARPEGLPVAAVYAGRANLVVCADGVPDPCGRGAAVNAHVDVIAPFFPPRLEGDTLFGRGSIDDKGNVAAICGALRLMAELAGTGAVTLKNRLTAMFCVEEEPGGNGSLALALDRELKRRYDSLLVMECAGLDVFPANRGATWFRCEARAAGGAAAVLPEAVAHGILAMQQEGAAIKAESDHPLFPHRPVQTCNGILGPFGEHPSRINGRVAFAIHADPATAAALGPVLERGLARYVADLGDKTRVFDPVTGRPKVERHLDVQPTAAGLAVTVYGATGHMGAILQNDDAILKWAYLVRALVESRLASGAAFTIALAGVDPGDRRLVLEGGQGFLPTHAIGAVQARMRRAFARGVGDHRARAGLPADAILCETTYEKLHNDAFAGDPGSPTLRNAIWAAEQAGVREPGAPVRGWDVSCDARLFAGEYPGMPVITGGVGELSAAHANDEHLHLEQLWSAVVFCALFLLRESGSAGLDS